MSETSPAPTADAPAPPAPAPAAPAPAPTTPAPPATPPAPADPAPIEAENVDQLPAWAQKIIRDTRAEAAGHRTKLTAAETAQQDAIRALAKAAGIDLPGDAPAPRPDEVAAQVAQAQQTARQAQVELAVYRAAAGAQGDPSALLDSRTFLAKVSDLDPASADFQTQVAAAVKAAVTDNPKLGAAPTVGSSSVDHAGGTGEQRARTPRPLGEAVTALYGA